MGESVRKCPLVSIIIVYVSRPGAAAGGGLECEDDLPPAALVRSGGHPVGRITIPGRVRILGSG